MTRLIDADKITYTPSVPIAVISQIVNAGREEDAKHFFHVSRADIDAQPTIDAEPVRHGKWIEYPIADGMNQCSECGVLRFGESNYCPNCGARMDEERKEE